MSQIDEKAILHASTRLMAGVFVLLAVSFSIKPEPISIEFYGTTYEFDGTQVRYGVLVGLGMIAYPFSAASITSLLGLKRASVAMALGGFTIMIMGGIIVYVIVLKQFAQLPLIFAILFAIPVLAGVIVALIAYLRKV